MQKVLQYLVLLFCYNLIAHDNNLVIIIDNLQQETVKTEEINMTHQVITALQQRASAVLASKVLWKNIIDRKKKFTKELENSESFASILFDMYQATNQQLKDLRYNFAAVNEKLSHVWFFEKYPQLAALSADDFNQLRFDFLCYTFEFDMSLWRVYDAHTNMLLFVPHELNYKIDARYEILSDENSIKNFDKRSYVIDSLQKLLLDNHDRWVIYLTGHGHPKMSKQGANIAGLKVNELQDLLHYFHHSMQVKLLVYASCYGGGVHAVEPYADLVFHYSIIVTALTDAPTFGFGLFEGMKLPPYDDQFKLQIGDVAKDKGLLPYAIQDYTAFFKRAWKGYFDLHLIQFISKFFSCDFLQCYVQKIENFPLIRKAGSSFFIPIKDGLYIKLVQQVTSPHAVVTASKPLLLYAKKVKKIRLEKSIPIISMIPGLVTHEIQELYAPDILFSSLVSEIFFSLEDMQLYKNFMIKKLVCLYDGQIKTLSHVMMLSQKNLMPKFIYQHADVLIYYQLAGNHYLALFHEQKMVDTMILDDEQIATMVEIQKFVEQTIDGKKETSLQEDVSFNRYVENKKRQQKISQNCIKAKICYHP